MKYIGKLYGHLGGDIYFDTGKNSNDWDELENKIKELEEENKILKQSLFNSIECVHDFVDKDLYWKSCKKCGKIVPFGQ